tara:strand:+ start:306 stop:1349 length:1044 start_codon:yes stop_codon:yes gene_type:complete
MAQLLITGGAGFIGSHACLSFLQSGFSLVVIDNYSNGSLEALRRVTELAGIKGNSKRLKIIEGDICDSSALDRAFNNLEEPIKAVVHFAGLKAVGESIRIPLKYWEMNLNGTLALLKKMSSENCRTLVFSSSATVYGYPKELPISERSMVNPVNPYGKTKAALENILLDLFNSESGWRIASLRYFNPVGAHPSGLIGEDPSGIPNNLFPFISQVGIGRREMLEIFGTDWPTSDGSAIRDFIHVLDLVEGHEAALELLLNEDPQFLVMNLGSGKGHSVFEVLNSFEKIIGQRLPHRIVERRSGDVACSIADATFAKERMGWQTKRSLIDMCKDTWTWQKANPLGYKSN